MDDYLSEKQFREIQDKGNDDPKKLIPIDKLTLSALQIFSGRYTDPGQRKISRLMVKVGTGIGKSALSLHVAMPYIRMFHSFYAKAGEKRHVFIIGFSRSVFIRELLKFPEFGIISYEELYHLKSYDHKIASSSGVNRDRFRQEKKSLVSKIKRRITTESLGGMFKFYGHKECANNLFVSDIPPEVNQSNLMEYYRDKKIKINEIFRDQFRGGLIIYDEAHQMYNSAEFNHYGLSAQFLNDYYGNDVFSMYLSATMLNNKSREIIDNANLMRDPGTVPFRSEDYFLNNKIIADLTPVINVYRGKTLFLEETNDDYPEIKYMGESYKNLDFLKFVTSDMSPLHEQTFSLDDLYNQKSKHFIINDMVLPNPEFGAELYELFHPDKYQKLTQDELDSISGVKGLYDTDNSKRIIKNAPHEWKIKVGIDVKDDNGITYLTGAFLKKHNLAIYSSKYVTMLDIVETELKTNPLVKFLIYHPYVKGSGILMIQEILRWNGFILYMTPANDETYSSELYITRKEWVAQFPNKTFNPATMVVLKYDITENKKDILIDEYNKATNKFGTFIKYFIGAQKIKQSYTFLNVQVQIIVHAPTNIPEWIQIRGRIYRKHAMKDLPPDMKQVRVYTLMSTSKHGQTLEEKKYYKKIEEFKIIQQIEYEINRIAVNNYISHQYGFKNIDSIGAKSFMPDIHIPDKISDFRYYADNYHLFALNEISNLIKRAFVSIPVWTYDTLYEFCEKSKLININVEMNKQIYNLALKRLIFTRGQSLVNMKNIVLFDSENYIIDKYYVDGVAYTMPRRVIVECGQYLMLAATDTYGNYQLYPDCFLTKNYKYIYNVFILDDKKLKVNQNYTKKILKDYKVMVGEEKANYHYLFLLHFPRDAHYEIMKNAIEKDDLPKPFRQTYQKLGIMGKDWWVDEYQKHTYSDGNWESTPYSMPIKSENHIVIGIIEDEKFKLKKFGTNNEYISDKRTIERGMVCTSSRKNELLDYIKQLDIMKKVKTSTQHLCIQIFIKLIELEGISQNSKGGLKYIYFI